MRTSRSNWHWFQTNWTRHFSPCCFNGIKIGTAFKCIFEETVPKLSVNGGNRNSQDSHKNQYPGLRLSWISVLRNHNTVNVDQIYRWSAISLPLVTHTEGTVLPARSFDSCSSGFVWNQLPRVGIITWSNDVITVPAYTKGLSEQYG